MQLDVGEASSLLSKHTCGWLGTNASSLLSMHTQVYRQVYHTCVCTVSTLCICYNTKPHTHARCIHKNKTTLTIRNANIQIHHAQPCCPVQALTPDEISGNTSPPPPRLPLPKADHATKSVDQQGMRRRTCIQRRVWTPTPRINDDH